MLTSVAAPSEWNALPIGSTYRYFVNNAVGSVGHSLALTATPQKLEIATVRYDDIVAPLERD